jgi:hypothetical protein
MTSSGCSVNDFSRPYNSTALLTASSGTFVFIAFLMRARSWYFSFLSFVIASDVVLGGVVAGDVVAGGVAAGVAAGSVVAGGVVGEDVVLGGVGAGEDGSDGVADRHKSLRP